MILNPNKIKALVGSRSRTVNHPHGILVLSRVSISASPNLNIIGVSLTAGSSSKTICMRLSHVSLKEWVFRGWCSVSLWTPLCCFVAAMHLFSQSLSIVLRCGGLLLNVIFSYLGARCIRWPGFALIRLCCAIDIMLQHRVCCTRLI